MEIYNERMELIENPDLTKGLLYDGERIEHHEAVEAVEEIFHWETVAEYMNGGKDVRKIIDVPGVLAQPAWDEKIPIKIYHEYTDKELAEIEAEKNKPTTDERLTTLEGKVEGMSEWEKAFKRGVQSA